MGAPAGPRPLLVTLSPAAGAAAPAGESDQERPPINAVLSSFRLICFTIPNFGDPSAPHLRCWPVSMGGGRRCVRQAAA